MSLLSTKELVFLILQFLDEEKYNDTLHQLEKESGLFFNLGYFTKTVMDGEWEEVEKYLSGFTKESDNWFLLELSVEIQRQKYLEALEKESERLFRHLDTKSARACLLLHLKRLIEANPHFQDRLHFPSIKNSSLSKLFYQSLICKNVNSNPDMRTLSVYHKCRPPNAVRAVSPVTNWLMGSIPQLGHFSTSHFRVHKPQLWLICPLCSTATYLVQCACLTQSTQDGDGQSLLDVRAKGTGALETSKTWKLNKISWPSQLRSLSLRDDLPPVIRMIYTNSGGAILALTFDAVHKLWKWPRSKQNPTGKATTSMLPQLWLPSSRKSMTNEISESNPEDALPCFALSKTDSYLISTSGGKISVFNMMTFKTMTTIKELPPAATVLAFHPQNVNIIAMGMDDSSIQIYDIMFDWIYSKLEGHHKRVTGLAFSNALNILVSSGADAQLCVWRTDKWEKQSSKFLQMPNGRVLSPLAQTCVQFHQDQIHLLAVNETQLAIFEAPKLENLEQWVPRESSGSVTDAAYSCNGQSIFASLEDGTVCVLASATLGLRCRIDPTAYLPCNPRYRVYPLVIASHPSEPNQFALGLTDGGVFVLEPLESAGDWGVVPQLDNGAEPSDQHSCT